MSRSTRGSNLRAAARHALPYMLGGALLLSASCSEEEEPSVATEEVVVDEGAAEAGAGGQEAAGAEGAADGEAPEPGAPPEGSDDAEQPERRFLHVEGTVTIDGAPASVGTEIPETAKIVTGKDGKAVITLEPGGIIEIRKDSTVEVGRSERKEKSLRLALGTLWSFVPNGSSYEVVTDNAVAGVRGTVFYMEAQSPKKTYLCACDGEIELVGHNPKLTKNLKSSMEHKAFTILTKGKRQVAKKAKRLNHTDAQKDALMEQAGQGG